MSMYFGKNIKYLRKNKNLGQVEFAKLFGVKHTTVSGWETGKSKPALDVFVNLSEYFGVSLDDLYYKNMEEEGVEPLSNTDRIGRMTVEELKYFVLKTMEEEGK